MATKKISELPLITALSGSQEETLIPVVVGGLNGTTNRITAENFSKFVNAYNATTSSNTFIGAQTINGNLTITGNQVISGRLTVYEVVAQYETASILFSTGSTKLGDQLTDTHEFTGSTNITGSIIVDGNLLLNGASLNNSFVRIHQATGSLQNFTSSQADRNLDLSIVTGSINQFTASQDDRNFVISQFTSSTDAHIVGISDFTSSQLIVNTGLASVTASLNNFSGSTNAFTGSIEKTTASIHLATASLNYFYQSTSSLNEFTSSQADRNLNLSIVTGSVNRFTASQDDRNYIISQYTASTDAHIVGISAFTSSQLAVNLGNSIYTASVDSHIVGISTYTSSVRDTLARIHQSTASLQQFTASQDDRNLTLSTVTGSLIGITNGLMAFTAALDNTYATDAQLYQLYQATRSLELHSGSMIGVTNGLMAYTASNSTLNTGLRGEVDGIEAYTASLKGQAIVSSSTQVQNYDVFALNSNLYTSTGSLIGITNGLMAFTAALDSTYATDAQLYQLYQATRSIELTTGSLIGITNGLMAFTAALDNTYATDVQLLPILQATQSLELLSGSLIGITNGLMAFTAALDSTYATDAQLYQLYAETASIKAEIGGIELYTASLKGAAIVSSSTQVQNYDVFALNSNLYNGTGSIKGEIAGIEAYTASLKGAAIVSSSQQITNYYKFAETASANTVFYGNVTASALNLTKSPDGIFAELGGNTPKLNLYKFSSGNVMNIGHNYYYDGVAYGKNDISLQGWEFRSHITNGQYTISHSPAGVTTLNQLIKVDATTGDLTITNGNLVMANGKGIDFSATPNSGSTVTSEILDDYEVGTWTPTDGSGAGLTFTTVFGRYVKIGKQVTVHFRVNYPSTADATAAIIGGLPYVVDSGNNYMGGVVHWTDASMVLTLMAIDTTSTLSVRRNADNADPTNANLSTKILRGTVTYQTF